MGSYVDVWNYYNERDIIEEIFYFVGKCTCGLEVSAKSGPNRDRVFPSILHEHKIIQTLSKNNL